MNDWKKQWRSDRNVFRDDLPFIQNTRNSNHSKKQLRFLIFTQPAPHTYSIIFSRAVMDPPPMPDTPCMHRPHQQHSEVLTHSRDKDCQSPHAAQVLTRCLLPTHTHRHTQILTHDAHALELTHTYTHTCYATFLFTLKKKSACFVFVHFFYSIFYHFLVFFFLNRKKSVGKWSVF